MNQEELTKKEIIGSIVLECLGVKIENCDQSEKSKYGIPIMKVFFSIPEKLEINSNDCSQDIKEEFLRIFDKKLDDITTDDAIKLTKEYFIRTLIDCVEEDWLKEEMQENISDIIRFFVKKRTGEIWVCKNILEVVNRFNDCIEEANQYAEV